jgi:hypothetical protein
MTKRAIGVAALLLTAAGCDEKLSDVAGPTPNLTPTFSSIQRDIFEAPDSSGRPACTSCHNAQQARFNGNLNLSGTAAYGQLVNVPSSGKPGATRVVPGRPDDSYLIHKIESAAGIVGQRMPLNGPYLTSGQVSIIRQWIDEGALNN